MAFQSTILTGEYDLTCTPVFWGLERGEFQCQWLRSGKVELQKASNHAGFHYAASMGYLNAFPSYTISILQSDFS